jgi:flagellar biosynthetic protein FliQ
MTSDATHAVVREGLMLLIVVGGPIFAALLISGLVIGVIQAATQINDPAVGFLPRLAIASGVMAFMGPWMVSRLAGFFAQTLTRIGTPPG